MEMVRARHPDVDKVTYDRLVNHALEGMMAGLDPFSSFIHPEMAQAVEKDDKAGEIPSLGMGVAVRDDGPYIASVAPHGVAEAAGLIPETSLLKIDGHDVKGATMAEWISALHRAPGEISTITVKSRIHPTPEEVKLTHRAVPTRSVAETKMLAEGDGYLRLAMFGRNCAEEVENALDDLEEKGMKRLILDLRENPGGELGETVKILGLFLPPSTTVVTVKGREVKPLEVMKTPARQRRIRKYPIVVLINRMSASASELTSGALQDLKRATIVGETSFGKGSVQQIYPMGGGTGLRLTFAKYYTPADRTPHGTGITPDVLVNMPEADRAFLADKFRLDSLPPDRRKAVENWADPCLATATQLPQ